VKYILVLSSALLFSGCSSKTSNFFEDVFADTKVIKAEGQFKGTVGKDPRTPILTTDETKSSKKNINKVQSYRGKIASVHFDRDFNLYVYTFIDHVTHEPVIFYYNKNIQRKSYNGDYRIYVKGNYLVKYIELKAKNSDPQTNTTNKTQSAEKEYIIRKTYKRRKRSPIKIPVEEKISPL